MLSSKWCDLNAHCNKFNRIYQKLKRSGESDGQSLKRCENIFMMKRGYIFNTIAFDGQQQMAMSHSVVVGTRNKKGESNVEQAIDLSEDDNDNKSPNNVLFADDPHPHPHGKLRKSKSQKTPSTLDAATSQDPFDDQKHHFRLVTRKKVRRDK